MSKPKLIIFYGFAGIGKTTLAKKLNLDIPFSLYIEADDLLNMIGQWLTDEDKARKYVFSLTKVMIEDYLKLNHDVIVPYLLTDNIQAMELEDVAGKVGADFVELFIKSNRTESISYLYDRGIWGESDSIMITEKDRPHIDQIYDQMEAAMKKRKNCKEIPYLRNDIELTYSGIKKVLKIK